MMISGLFIIQIISQKLMMVLDMGPCDVQEGRLVKVVSSGDRVSGCCRAHIPERQCSSSQDCPPPGFPGGWH